MQPYFFPYIGYYSLIKHTDKWVIFDVVQFIRHGWIERNRILKPGEGWQYVSVPLVKHSRDTLIKDIKIRTEEDWKDKLFRQLEHYKKAPFFKQAVELIREAINIETDSIVLLNANILKITCEFLSIPFEVNIFSKMEVNIEPVNHAGEWALQISKALQAKEYVNPPGGIEIFNNQQFEKENIKLSFINNTIRTYSQRRPSFEPGLSIIDILMYNDTPAISAMLDDIDVINK
jgi:hypothetical protein